MAARVGDKPSTSSGETFPRGRPSLNSCDWRERALTFDCHGAELAAVIHRAGTKASAGVLIVVGGPQYRVGSHRQFVLLARALVLRGIPVMRFDYRGMGDSEGPSAGFESVGPDIRAAIDCFQGEISSIKQIVLWGLCDAASACCFYAAGDPRVAGMVLLNPWVRSVEGEAKAVLKHYYGKRLTSGAFWRKVGRGEFDLRDSLGSLWSKIKETFGIGSGGTDSSAVRSRLPLKERVFQGLGNFDGKVLLILSGNDLTAKEFVDAWRSDPDFSRLLGQDRFQQRTLEEADHTFSRATWRDQVAEWTSQWAGNL